MKTKSNKVRWILAASLLPSLLAAITYAQPGEKHLLTISLVQAEEQLATLVDDDATTSKALLEATYLCELCALPKVQQSVVLLHNGTTVTFVSETYAAWDMLFSDTIATLVLEQGYRGECARWPVWLRVDDEFLTFDVHLTTDDLMAVRNEWFGQ